MSLAVRFDAYGPSDVLEVREVDDPSPAGDRVRVAVVAAGINPGEIMIREGALAEVYPATFPSGQGTDFAGRVAAVGPDVTAWSVGDEVVGFTDERAAHAQFVAVPEDQLLAKPAAVGFDVAGSLAVAATTAWACVHAVGAGEGDTVVIAGASGGVGVIAVQLAVARGARVVGTTGSHADELRALGAEPVAYGDGVADRIRELAPDGVDAFIDCFGSGNVALAVDELGVDPARVNTIADFGAVGAYGVQAEGGNSVDRRQALTEILDLVAAGRITVPIAARYPLERVRDAYEELGRRHTFGKIVLEVGAA